MTKLHIVSELHRGQSYHLEGDTIYLGRSADNDIQVKDKFVSRKHLKIFRKGNRYFIEDLKSCNGTFVNGKQIGAGIAFEIKEGLPIGVGMSVVCLGDTYPKDIKTFLDSIGIPEKSPKKLKLPIKDRRVTPQNYMELIYEVSNVLMGSLDPHEISEKMLNYLFHLLQRIDRGAIILIDRWTGKISKVIPRFRKPSVYTTTNFSQRVVDRVIREGQAVIVPNAHTEDDTKLLENLKLLKIGSLMCVPMISRSRMIGVIYADSINKPYGFRKGDPSLVTTFGTRAALAMENALLYTNLEGKGKREEKITAPSEPP